MDLQRVLLLAALAFTSMLMWQAWQKDYGPTLPQPVAVETSPSAPTDTPSPGAPPAADTPQPPPSVAASPARASVRVRTDLLDVEIDTLGGDLSRVALLDYPVAANQPGDPVVLLNETPTELFVAQSGLISSATSAATPTHHAQYEAEQSEYTLAPGATEVQARLTWRDPSGLTVTKVYTFHRGSYLVDTAFEVANATQTPWSGSLYAQLQRTEPASSSRFVYTYTGGVIYSPEEKYEKIKFEDMRNRALDRSVTGGWLAMIQHYFLAAWIPSADQTSRFYTKTPDGRYVLGLVGPQTSVAPGETQTISTRLYVGPKLHDVLGTVAPGLDLTVDYGVLTLFANILFWLLSQVHKLVGNWGWAIIIVTILIKLVFYKLSETSYKSMAHMRKVQPRLMALKERFGDDREKLNEAMMRMYKEEKINPLGGCLPILVQIPVFIALYWVLLESVEMRQADFILWLNDLSSPDPYFVLPLVMGVTMLIQHRLNPTPLDPIQAKVMLVLPIVFTVFFAFFPAGLVLYWVVNNTLSIAQQWYITRHVVKA